MKIILKGTVLKLFLVFSISFGFANCNTANCAKEKEEHTNCGNFSFLYCSDKKGDVFLGCLLPLWYYCDSRVSKQCVAKSTSSSSSSKNSIEDFPEFKHLVEGRN